MTETMGNVIPIGRAREIQRIREQRILEAQVVRLAEELKVVEKLQEALRAKGKCLDPDDVEKIVKAEVAIRATEDRIRELEQAGDSASLQNPKEE